MRRSLYNHNLMEKGMSHLGHLIHTKEGLFVLDIGLCGQTTGRNSERQNSWKKILLLEHHGLLQTRDYFRRCQMSYVWLILTSTFTVAMTSKRKWQRLTGLTEIHCNLLLGCGMHWLSI